MHGSRMLDRPVGSSVTLMCPGLGVGCNLFRNTKFEERGVNSQ